ncbi:MAG: PKD domain-containing protein [Thermoanaerobaculia bacterium]|nr:PKD domain-containing protein [Thermoanaerobaculia bacterium]
MFKAWLGRVRATFVLSQMALVLFAVAQPALATPAAKDKAPAVCEGFDKKQKIARMGGRNAFARKGVKTVADLQKVTAAQEADLRALLASQGLGDVADGLLAAIREGRVSEGSLQPGDQLDWMAYRKKGKDVATIDDACLASRRAYDTFVVEVPVVKTQEPVAGTCNGSATGSCETKMLKVAASGSAGLMVSMTGPSGTQTIPADWSGAMEQPYKPASTYSFTAKAEGTPGARKTTTHKFVIPKVCVNFAYQGSTMAEEKIPAPSCSKTVAPVIDGEEKKAGPLCKAIPPSIELSSTNEDQKIWRGESITIDGTGHWTDDQVMVEVTGPDGNPVPVEAGKTFPMTLGPFDKPGTYTVKVTVTNEAGDTATDTFTFEVLTRWAVRPYLWAASPIDESVRTVTPAAAGRPEERTKFSLGSAQGVGLGLSYFLTERVSLDTELMFGQTDGNFVHDVGPAWDMGDDSGSILGLAIGPTFHLTPGKRVDVFAGPFVGLFDLGDYEFNGLNRKLDRSFDSEVGFGAQLGLGIPFGQQSPWAGFFAGRYMKLSGEVDGTSQELDIDPLALVAGVSFNF